MAIWADQRNIASRRRCAKLCLTEPCASRRRYAAAVNAKFRTQTDSAAIAAALSIGAVVGNRQPRNGAVKLHGISPRVWTRDIEISPVLHRVNELRLRRC